MTSRWLTCSSLAVVLVLPLAAASVTGRIELRDSQDRAVQKKRDYSGVVVWLEPLNRTVAPRALSRPARMDQKDKTFVPHILAIPTGANVEFPNSDPIFHNAFSNYDGQVFDIGLYPPGTSRTVRFSRPGVVRVFCNIHAAMSAVIVVLSTPYYATTAAGGTFDLGDVPAGEYQLRLFHERALPATLEALERRVTIGLEPVALAPMTVSEGGYLAIPHQNKFGKHYPPAPDEGGLYPATKK